MREKQFLTKEKYQQLEAELRVLETVKRKEVADKLEYSRSLGDLSENAEYNDARNEQAEVESRITYLAELLKNAEVLEYRQADTVEVGSTVTITKNGQSEKVTYQLVSSEESDIMENKISYESPLGRALLGKSKKAEFEFETPSGIAKYKIIDIN